MKMNTVLLSTLSFALVSFQAGASEISFNTLPTTVENNTYNGFVGVTIDGLSSNIVCDDYYPTTYVPSGPWAYNMSVLPSLTFARFGSDATALYKYSEAAVLLGGDGGALAGLENVTDSDTITSYQYALWVLFSPTVKNFGNSASLLNTAGLDVSSGTLYSAYDQLKVYTPSESAASNQEFLGMGGSIGRTTAAPEPGTTILMGVGLLISSFLGRNFVRVREQRNKTLGKIR
jgi:hypothetical protein